MKKRKQKEKKKKKKNNFPERIFVLIQSSSFFWSFPEILVVRSLRLLQDFKVVDRSHPALLNEQCKMGFCGHDSDLFFQSV